MIHNCWLFNEWIRRRYPYLQVYACTPLSVHFSCDKKLQGICADHDSWFIFHVIKNYKESALTMTAG